MMNRRGLLQILGIVAAGPMFADPPPSWWPSRAFGTLLSNVRPVLRSEKFPPEAIRAVSTCAVCGALGLQAHAIWERGKNYEADREKYGDRMFEHESFQTQKCRWCRGMCWVVMEDHKQYAHYFPGLMVRPQKDPCQVADPFA